MSKLSIITVNLNNASGLQKTMESIFHQSFNDYEYIIIDGGSTDGSRELIKKHENKLVYWVSEKDNGIYNAMNKGLSRATGEYLFFLNSGDYFYSNSILGRMMDLSDNADIIYGNIKIASGEEGVVKSYPKDISFQFFRKGGHLPHQASLIKRSLFNTTGLFNEEKKIVSDWEFYIKAICLKQAKYKHVDFIVSYYESGGISSRAESISVINEERQSVLSEFFQPFLEDYKKAEEETERSTKTLADLRLYQNSRVHKIVDRIIGSHVYKNIKKVIDKNF